VLTDYTSLQDIRAALGVNDVELPDETLCLSLYLDGLEGRLAVYPPAFFTALDEARSKPYVALTPVEKRLLRAARTFSTYAVALHLTESLPLFAPEQVTDSKAGMERPASAFKAVTEAIQAAFNRAKGALDEVAEEVGGGDVAETISRQYFLAVGQSFDPVTGE
jgi:hypothetical protein